MWPSSRFALSLKPSVAYLVLNLCALWKKQMTWPSLAYAGIPYQVFGERTGALALMIAWSRSPMTRSGAGIVAIFASTTLSPSALSARGPRRAAAFSSWARSLIAARSSSVNPWMLLAGFFATFFVGFLSAIVSLRRFVSGATFCDPLRFTTFEKVATVSAVLTVGLCRNPEEPTVTKAVTAATDYKYYVTVLGGQLGDSMPNCLAYSAFSRRQPPNFMASGPTMRPMGVPLRRRSSTSKQMCHPAAPMEM